VKKARSRKKPGIPLPVLAACLIVLLPGCSIVRSQVITLCTNRPEMAAYVEYFNTLSPDHKVVLCYRANPADSAIGRKKTDLILGPWLNGAAASRHFESVDRLFKRGYLLREDFYPGLLNAGTLENRQVLLPLSFNLPAVVFRPGAIPGDVPKLIASLEYVSEKGGAFNRSVHDRFVRMGFSPLWQPGFLYTAAAIYGAQFRETPEGSVHWNSARLRDMKEFCTRWIDQINLGYEQDSLFQKKYLYEPMPKLLEEGRIAFYTTDSSALFRNQEKQAEDADFRWLGAEDRVPVQETVLYFGIPRGARNKRGARLFLSWILQPETQGRLLEIDQRKRLDTFGIAGGFSSLRAVNEREFPQVYKRLLGRMPPEEMLVFPKALPVSWAEQKQRIVIPWMVSFVLGTADEERLSRLLAEYHEE
jgi:hypothetical protein